MPYVFSCQYYETKVQQTACGLQIRRRLKVGQKQKVELFSRTEKRSYHHTGAVVAGADPGFLKRGPS